MNTANQTGAVEVNDVASAAEEIERRMTASEDVADNATQEITESNEEVITEEQSEDAQAETEIQDESTETETSEDESEELTESETEEPNEDTTETFETVSDLAEALDMPLEEFMGNIKGKVKINGEEKEVSLSDLTSGYQMESDYRRKTTDLAEQRKTFEQETEQSHAQIQTKLQEVELLSTNLENQLMEDFNSVDWKQLENEDREEWLVQRQKFGERQTQINQVKQQAQYGLQEYAQAQQVKHEEALQQHLAKENELLLTVIPEWSDPVTREQEGKEMTQFLLDNGFNEYEASNIQDHRIVKMIRDSFKRQNMTEKVDIAKKKVKKLPKIIKAGAKVTKQDIAAQSKKNKTQQFLKTGSRDDLVAALIERSN